MICHLCALPKMGVRGYLSALPSLIRKEREDFLYRVYVTDALRLIGENTGGLLSALGGSGAGIPTRWADILEDSPQKEETRTAEEVVEHIRQQIALA